MSEGSSTTNKNRAGQHKDASHERSPVEQPELKTERSQRDSVLCVLDSPEKALLIASNTK